MHPLEVLAWVPAICRPKVTIGVQSTVRLRAIGAIEKPVGAHFVSPQKAAPAPSPASAAQLVAMPVHLGLISRLIIGYSQTHFPRCRPQTGKERIGHSPLSGYTSWRSSVAAGLAPSRKRPGRRRVEPPAQPVGALFRAGGPDGQSAEPRAMLNWGRPLQQETPMDTRTASLLLAICAAGVWAPA